jgi:hypothetical protein
VRSGSICCLDCPDGRSGSRNRARLVRSAVSELSYSCPPEIEITSDLAKRCERRACAEFAVEVAMGEAEMACTEPLTL